MMMSRLLALGLRAKNTTQLVRLFSTNPSMPYENVLVSRPDPAVALITLNRPKALNALNAAHFNDISMALKEADEDQDIGAMVITGSDRAFAGMSPHALHQWVVDNFGTAGADIKEMKDKTCMPKITIPFVPNLTRPTFLVSEAYMSNFLSNWEVIAKLRKPVIAAVSGYAVCPLHPFVPIRPTKLIALVHT